MTLLQNAVSPIRELANVRQQIEILYMANGAAADYMQYRNLLISACSQYDRSRVQSITTVHVNNVEFTSELLPDNDDDYLDIELDIDDDNLIPERNDHQDIYGDHLAQRFPNQLKNSTWNTISPSDQAAWDKLSPEGKQTILNYVSKNLNQLLA